MRIIPGLSDAELDGMGHKRFVDYLRCAEMLSASNRLEGIEASSYPNLKPSSQQSVRKDLRQKASEWLEKVRGPAASMKEIARLLSGGM